MLGFLRWDVIDNVIFDIDSKDVMNLFIVARMIFAMSDSDSLPYFTIQCYWYECPFEQFFTFFLRAGTYLIQALDVSIPIRS